MFRFACLSLAAATAALSVAPVAGAAPRVWVVDHGEKVKRDATSLPFADGTDNAVWSPGKPVHMFALRNETVALQGIVQADAATLDGVTVDLGTLACAGGTSLANAPGATDPTTFVGRPIERFVEHYFDVTRASPGPGEGNGSAGGAACGCRAAGLAEERSASRSLAVTLVLILALMLVVSARGRRALAARRTWRADRARSAFRPRRRRSASPAPRRR